MKYRMGGIVWILSSKKTDGLYNKGKIVGVELNYYGLGYMTERQYLNDFGHPRYKVAYVDCFTNRACSEWLCESDLQKNKPEA